MLKQTQAERLEDYLKIHGHIGPLEAWSELGIYRLSATIHRLKNTVGLNIVTKRENVINSYGETCSVARYVHKGTVN